MRTSRFIAVVQRVEVSSLDARAPVAARRALSDAPFRRTSQRLACRVGGEDHDVGLETRWTSQRLMNTCGGEDHEVGLETLARELGVDRSSAADANE